MLGRAAAEQQRHPQSLGHVLVSESFRPDIAERNGIGQQAQRARSAKFCEASVFGLIIEEVERTTERRQPQADRIVGQYHKAAGKAAWPIWRSPDYEGVRHLRRPRTSPSISGPKRPERAAPPARSVQNLLSARAPLAPPVFLRVKRPRSPPIPPLCVPSRAPSSWIAAHFAVLHDHREPIGSDEHRLIERGGCRRRAAYRRALRA